MTQRKPTSIGTVLTIGACVLVAILCFGAFAQKGFQREEPRPTETIEFMPDHPDCDKDDRSPHWEVADCGPSPIPAVRTSSRPMKTAFQPAPKTTRR